MYDNLVLQLITKFKKKNSVVKLYTVFIKYELPDFGSSSIFTFKHTNF